MKLGMNLLLWTAAAGEEHLNLIDDIKAWGFDGVEFPMFTPDCSPWEKLGRHSKDNGLACTAVGILPEEASLIEAGKAPRQKALDHLKASVDSCVTVGAEALAGPIYHPVGALVGRGPTDDEKRRCVDGLKALADYAEGSGIIIAVEPLNRFETFVMNSQADTRAITDAVASENVGQLYDTFHANIEEKSLEAAIEAGGSRIRHVHVSANDRATPGEDHIDWTATFSALKGIGYDGWPTIEAFGSWLPEIAGATCIWRKMAPNEEHVAREGCRFIREAWEQA